MRQGLQVNKNAATLRDLTVQTLRRAIFDQVLPPGERLVERDLCERTGVSRTCLREALQFLESEGLVSRSTGKGLVVVKIGAEEARELYEIRSALERLLGIGFAERAGAEERKALKDAADAVGLSTNGGLHPNYISTLDEFYEILARGARNDMAHRMLNTLKSRITYLRLLTSRHTTAEREQETARLLQQIAAAAANGDADRTGALCESFASRSADFAIPLLKLTGLDGGTR